jgi:hypothetical protein
VLKRWMVFASHPKASSVVLVAMHVKLAMAVCRSHRRALCVLLLHM